MNDEMINLICLILKKSKEELQSEIEKLENEKASIEKELSDLNSRYNDLNKSGKYSFLDRYILKRKEYQDYINSKSRFNEEYFVNSRDLRNKIDELDSNIRTKKSKIEKSNSFIEYPYRIDSETLSLFFGDYQEIEDFCKNKDINLSYKAMLFLGKKGDDVEFMKNVINEDFRLIGFDETYSFELYKELIDKLNEYIFKNTNKFYVNDTIRKDLSELYDKIFTGKYDNHFVKHIMDFIKYICSSIKFGLDKNIEKYYFSLPARLNDGKLYRKYKKEDFGLILEQIYENEDYVIGCHGTAYKPKGDIIADDMIFKNGVREPDRGGKGIAYTVANGIPFLEVLDYDQGRYGDVSGGYAYILSFPKEDLRDEDLLWQYGEDGRAYIKPKYVVAKYKQFSEDASIIINPYLKEKDDIIEKNGETK